jgi:hypothetical protein
MGSFSKVSVAKDPSMEYSGHVEPYRFYKGAGYLEYSGHVEPYRFYKGAGYLAATCTLYVATLSLLGPITFRQ